MRKINFRGYDIDNKCWRYSNGTSFFEIDGIGAEISYYNIAEESIGQYIGLKDKNGKEIYKSKNGVYLTKVVPIKYCYQRKEKKENEDKRIK